MSETKNNAIMLARDLSAALMELHRTLIHAEAGNDPDFQNPYTLLFSVIGGGRFEWMRGLSQMIVRLDDMVAEGEVNSIVDLQGFRREAAQFLGQEEGADAKVRLRFLNALQRAPDVAIATGRLKHVLRQIPVVEKAVA